NAHGDLLTGKAEITVAHGAIRNEFLKGLELVLLPVGVVEIFVEDDDRTRHDPLCQQGEDRPRRGVEVAVDVNERNWSRICFEPRWNGALEPTPMQPHIVGHSWKPTPGVEHALTKIVAAPVLGQALEAVEAVNDAVADLSRDETNGAAGENPELEIV